MRSPPNPWIVVPTLVAAVGGGIVGYFVTDASCAPDSCALVAGIVATVVAFGTAAGVGTVMVLTVKSLVEWREHANRDVLTTTESEKQGPPTC